MVGASMNAVGTSLEKHTDNILVKKYTNGMEIIDSGVLISYNSQDIIININSVRIRFEFLESKNITNGGNIKINPEKNIENAMVVSLYNMESLFPEGTPHPLHVANVGSSRILISFFVNTVDKKAGVRIFQYSLMAGE